MLLVAPSGEHLKYVVQMHFAWEEATNIQQSMKGSLPGSGCNKIGNQEVDHSRGFTACGETSQQGLPKSIDGGIR